jgi:hypothetical protein
VKPMLGVAGAILILAGLLIPPDPWVLLWAPGIGLIIASRVLELRAREERRPGYINDPWKKD